MSIGIYKRKKLTTIHKKRIGEGVRKYTISYCINCKKQLTHYNSKRCIKCHGKYLGIKMKNKIGNAYIDGRTLMKNKCKDCNNYVKGVYAIRCRSCASKIIWKQANSKLREKMSNFLKFPNKLELKISKILSKKYKYVGDGKFWIERFNPDFINVNGKKIIEIFGEHWHANPNKYKANDIICRNKKAKDIWENDKQRLKTYKKYGYDTLIIWEHEINNIEDEEVKKELVSEFKENNIK